MVGPCPDPPQGHPRAPLRFFPPIWVKKNNKKILGPIGGSGTTLTEGRTGARETFPKGAEHGMSLLLLDGARALEALLNRPVEGGVPFKARYGLGVSQAGLRRNGVVRSAVLKTSPIGLCPTESEPAPSTSTTP